MEMLEEDQIEVGQLVIQEELHLLVQGVDRRTRADQKMGKLSG